MNIHEQVIENTLHHATQPKPPAGLKEKLIAQMHLPAARHPVAPFMARQPPGGWLRRWWPTLAPATISVACAAMLAVQYVEIQDLKGTVQTLTQAAAAKEAAAVALANPPANPAALEAAAREQQEIERLKQVASRLAGEVAQLEQQQIENAKLRNQLATIPASLPAEMQADLAVLEKAKEKAQSVACVNNLKQLGLCVRVWATDNKDAFPPDIISMTNEMSTPKILVCPADTGRAPAPNWASFTTANCSYQYLGASASATEPNRVLWICPIHGNVTLCDGSVQMQMLKTHPEQFTQQNGGLYLNPASPSKTAPSGR